MATMMTTTFSTTTSSRSQPRPMTMQKTTETTTTMRCRGGMVTSTSVPVLPLQHPPGRAPPHPLLESRGRRQDATGGDGNNVVDIAFHETAGLAAGGRRSVTFTDNLGFIVGTLGEEGGMFATDLVEDDDEYYDGEDEDNFAGLGVMSAIARKAMRRSRKVKRKAGGGGAGGSSLYFYRFETFGRNANKDWVMVLPDGEDD